MASLGALGVEHPAPEDVELDTFDWFGAKVRVVDSVTDTELIDLMEASREVDSRSLAAMVIIKDSLRALIHGDDFPAFWRLAKEKRQNADDLTQVFMLLVSEATGRPTQQPSDSSAGRLDTTTSSPAGSSSPAYVGRPDLQVVREDSVNVRQRMQELSA